MDSTTLGEIHRRLELRLGSLRRLVAGASSQSERLAALEKLGNALALWSGGTAIEPFTEALRLADDGATRFRLLLSVAHTHLRTDDFSAAEAGFERCVAVADEMHLGASRCRALAGLGRVIWLRDGAAPARPLFEEALGRSIQERDPIGEGEARFGLALCARLRNDWREALPLFDSAVWLLSTGSPDVELRAHELQSYAFREIGFQHVFLGQFSIAEACYRRAFDLASADGIRRGVGYALLHMGILAFLRCEYRIADGYLRYADEWTTASGSSVGPATVAVYRGRLQERLGDYDAARTLFEASLQVHIGKEILGEGEALLELGDLSVARGDADAALNFYQRAKDVLNAVGNKRGIANFLVAESQLLLRKDQFANADRSLQQAIRLSNQIGDPRYDTHLYRFRALSALNKRTAATRELTTYLSRAREAHDERAEAIGLIARGEQIAATRAEGMRDLIRARELLTKIGAPRQLAEANAALARVAALAARDSGEPIGGSLRTTALGAGVAAVRGYEHLRRNLGSSASRRRFYLEHRPDYLFALHLAEEEQDGVAALAVAEASRVDALAVLLRQGIRDLDTGSDPFILADLNGIESARSQEGSGPVDSPDVRAATETYSRIADEALQARLDETYGPLLRPTIEPEPVDVDAIVQALRGNAHALLYELDTSSPNDVTCYAIWVRPSGESSVTRTQLNGRVLESLHRICNYRRASDDLPAELAAPASSNRMQDLACHLLPRGLRETLRDSATPLPLVVAPCGGLWGVPFGALPLDTTGLVIQKACVTLVPSLTLNSLISEGETGDSAFVYLSKDLRGISKERSALDELFLKLGFRIKNFVSDKDELLTSMRSAEPWELGVISAHGDSSPGFSHALHLSDGSMIHAGTLLTCRLPRTFVLGACSSGALDLEPGNEPWGIPTAALVGGAKSVVAALFPIPQDATGRILAGFYGHLETQPAAPALREAQLAFLRENEEKGESPPVWEWAGLTTIGANGASLAA